MITPAKRMGRWVVGIPLLTAALLMGSAAQPATQTTPPGAAYQRLMERALGEGSVAVIIHLDVPGIAALTAASATLPVSDVSRAVGEQRMSADVTLKEAIDQAADGVLRTLPIASYTVNNRYGSIPFVALRVTPGALAMLQASPRVLGIEEDVPVELIEPARPPDEAAAGEGDYPRLDGTAGLVGATTAWSWGFTGAGWHVAVLDTGIRASHQFFAGKSIVEACFAKGADGVAGAGDCPNGTSTQTGPGSAVHYPNTYSSFDHGTHVSGIATGSAGSLAGIAKGAGVLAVQVFSKMPASSCSGSVPCVTSWNSDSLAGLDYVYSIRGSYKVASVNMSLGGSLSWGSPCDSDARRAAIDNLRTAGIATAIATGNAGWCTGISAPACISSSVAVGSTTDADNQSSFSNWHATLQKVFAPGSSIYSSTGGSDTSYASWNGTSMATPHVAGAWALMKQVVPNGSVTDFLNALRTTGVSVTSACDGRQTPIPRIRVDRAIATLTRYLLTIQASQYGTTDPSPGAYYYAPGTLVQITAVPETYAIFIDWSGAASGSANPLTVTMDADKSVFANFRFIYAPAASGRKVENRSFSQLEHINVLSWQANPANQGLNITHYRIYLMNGSTGTLLAEVPGGQSEYLHRKAGLETRTYAVVAVANGTREGVPAMVTVQ